MIKTNLLFLISISITCLMTPVVFASDSKTDAIPTIPAPGLVTMLDLGADKCIPCKMMAPIIAELQTEYDGRASIIFIDVWKRPEQALRFGISSIPTQIFYDKKGKEIGRHVGFLDKKSIVATFKKLDVPEGSPQ